MDIFFYYDDNNTNNKDNLNCVVIFFLYITVAKMAEQLYHTVHICRIVCISHSIGILYEAASADQKP